MFSLKAQLITHSTFRCVVSNIVRGVRRDPGINKRKKLLRLDNEDEEIDCEFDDFEADFMDVDKSHREHISQIEALKERIKYRMVQQKYFKDKFPNFLTWHDKEQIRYLSRTNPEEWTIARLSEGFPALPTTIKKIVKGNWTKTNEQKIKSHDGSVQKNWNLFKTGQFQDLSKDLKEHLEKFTDRSLNLNAFVPPTLEKKVVPLNPQMGTEFADIINSYQKTKTEEPIAIEDNTLKNIIREDEKLRFTRVKKSMTLKHLQESIQDRISMGRSKYFDDQLLASSTIGNDNTQKETKIDLIDINQEKYHSSTGISFYKKAERTLKHLEYPERITIPKKIFKKGFTYKLNDCYYDDDGEFLYRVPGMM